jgi:DNA-binding NarL/FixJ family response regulator
VSERLRVVIAEDNYLVREGTRRLLEDSSEVDVIGAVGTAEELLEATKRLHPDAVITDIRMPPEHHVEGIRAAHEIRSRHPEVGVVVLSQHAGEAYAFELLKEGTSGLAYLLKDRVDDTEEVVRALREVCAGRSVIDPLVVESLVARRARLHDSPLAELTQREMDVLRLMAGKDERRDRREPLPLGVSGGEIHQLALTHAWAHRGDAGPSARRGRLDAPSGHRPDDRP